MHYEHEKIGFNYRMSNICAGIGRGQMTVLEDHIKHHQHVHELYSSLMNNPSVSRVSINPNPDFNSNFWLTTALFNDGVDIETLCKKLDAAGIEARPVWKPMHKQPVYKNCPAYVNGVSEAIFKVGMCLPAGPYVKDDDVKYIVDKIKEAII